tara:strand:+ start:4793 stop:6397 length:1605 start_codon:yes stop_codon:yes gene_type:complete
MEQKKKVNEVDKGSIDAAVQQALDSDIPVPKTRPTKVPRPKPRPTINIGSDPKTGATRGIDPRDNYSPEDLKRLLMQSAMERMETEGKSLEDKIYADIKAGMSKDAIISKYADKDNDPLLIDVMYSRIKFRMNEGKSLSTLRNRSSFDAQNRLKDKNKLPTPKVVKPAQMDLFDDEGSMSDLHARIMSSDDPHDAIYKMLTQDGPEEKYIQDMYNDTSAEYGLHPDDDFEDIIDRMVDEMEGDMPFEGYYVMPDIDKERYTPMQGLEGPFQTRVGKPIYYDPKEGAYYDRDTDMYLTYAEFKALDDPKPDTGRMKEDFTLRPLQQTKRAPMSNTQNFRKNFAKRYQSLYPSSNLSTTREGKSPHKKGTEKYKKHMAAMHANSVDLNTMRDALKLDESANANTVVAEYTRATLDRSYKNWKQVNEQIAFIKSFVKEDVDVNAVATMLRKMHERENLDHNILVKENIDKLRDIVKDKSAMSVKFADGSMKVDMTTASIFLQVFDKVKEETQAKIVDRIQTKAGFLSVLDKMYSMIG